jgi:hypothetical protein
MRERREVPARPHGSPGRDDGQHAPIEALDEQLHDLDPRAGIALRESVRA